MSSVVPGAGGTLETHRGMGGIRSAGNKCQDRHQVYCEDRNSLDGMGVQRQRPHTLIHQHTRQHIYEITWLTGGKTPDIGSIEICKIRSAANQAFVGAKADEPRGLQGLTSCGPSSVLRSFIPATALGNVVIRVQRQCFVTLIGGQGLLIFTRPAYTGYTCMTPAPHLVAFW